MQGIKGYYKMKKAELLKELRIEESVDNTCKTMGQKCELTDQKLLYYYMAGCVSMKTENPVRLFCYQIQYNN